MQKLKLLIKGTCLMLTLIGLALIGFFLVYLYHVFTRSASYTSFYTDNVIYILGLELTIITTFVIDRFDSFLFETIPSLYKD